MAIAYEYTMALYKSDYNILKLFTNQSHKKLFVTFHGTNFTEKFCHFLYFQNKKSILN